MIYIERILTKAIRKAAKTFPSVTLTGPRQSGKSTLVKMLFSKTHTYVSLENPDIRIRAREDPAGFLDYYHPPVVIDEIQYVPELLSYIKTRIDQKRTPGQWILTGSHHFTLMSNIAQSLAGRTAVLYLLPFSIAERYNNSQDAQNISAWLKNLAGNRALNIAKPFKQKVDLNECLLRGFYPEIAIKKNIDRKIWCSSYITTYIERDIRNLANIGDLNQFERFVVACAVRTGQILNISEVARDIGISVTTAKRWLSLLETGHQIYLLYPYYRNIGKRMIKSPKLYFIDPAICTYLLGVNDATTLYNSLHSGNLFETMVVGDFLKRFLHGGDKPSMYYLRTQDGLEVDLVIEKDGGSLHLFEIKAAKTITSRHAASLLRISRDKNLTDNIVTRAVIAPTDENFFVTNGIMNYAWQNILTR